MLLIRLPSGDVEKASADLYTEYNSLYDIILTLACLYIDILQTLYQYDIDLSCMPLDQLANVYPAYRYLWTTL